MGDGIRVGLVGCASQELQRPAPARDLYISQLFRKASAHAEATAKNGLVHPDTKFGPYDMAARHEPYNATADPYLGRRCRRPVRRRTRRPRGRDPGGPGGGAVPDRAPSPPGLSRCR
ncbi:MAG: DUF6884 domain-containing protein [Arthrobacter sp.]